MLDDEWHTIRAEREGAAAALFIDGRKEGENRTEGLDYVDVAPPIFYGGVSADLAPLLYNILRGVRNEFGGCLRDFKINDRKFQACRCLKKIRKMFILFVVCKRTMKNIVVCKSSRTTRISKR